MISRLPALLMVKDLLPGGGPLNGRRWAGQQLLQLWSTLAEGQGLPIISSDLDVAQLEQLLRGWGEENSISVHNLLDIKFVERCGGLLVPDPSIGLWSLWRDALSAPASFSLIGQIHTVCTVGAMKLLEELSSENVFEWDGVVCSSRAGRAVVESVLDQREERQAARMGVSVACMRHHRPQLPVIPLPMPVAEMQRALPDRGQARQALELPSDADVVLWLGRITLFSKADPAPTYRVLDRVAAQRDRTLVLIELGPDDGSQEDVAQLQRLRTEYRHLKFLRIGADQPVSEERKQQALAAADIGVSLVDNVQETFGQSVVELMAAGLPVVVSDWDGYRDLLVHGQHGWLVPSRWSEVAAETSIALGWQHRVGLRNYAEVAGALAQLVQLDLEAAEAAVLTLLSQPQLRRAMGQHAASWALRMFDRQAVAASYADLLLELEDRRRSAAEVWQKRNRPPLGMDPVTCFGGFASEPRSSSRLQQLEPVGEFSEALASPRRQQLWQLLQACLPETRHPELRQALEIKHGYRHF